MTAFETSAHLARRLFEINSRLVRGLFEITQEGIKQQAGAGREFVRHLPEVRALRDVAELQRELAVAVLQDAQRQVAKTGALLIDAVEQSGIVLSEAFTLATIDATTTVDDVVQEVREVAKEAQAVIKDAVTADSRAPRSGNAEDDLTVINGIGPTLSARLREAGIRSLSQIAALDLKALDDEAHPLHSLQGRIRADRWVQQARSIIGTARVVNL